MVALLVFLLTLFALPLKSKSRLEAENAVLKHQLTVLRRKVRGRSSSPMAIAYSKPSCFDGFRRF